MAELTIENGAHRSMAVDGGEGPLNISEQSARENPPKCLHAPTLGVIFWTGKPKSLVRDVDRERLNSVDGPNNNRKRRPWIVVEELGDNVRVIGSFAESYRSSTTQGYKGWDAVAEEHKQFFLPIDPTISNGRPVLGMKEDFDGRFVGKSLLYLGIDVVISASTLHGEQCMGYLDQGAVAIIQRERKLILEAERAVRPEKMWQERGLKNPNWRGRNRADGGNCLDRDLMGEGCFDDLSSPNHPGPLVRPEFSNSSNTGSTGRPSSARPRHPAGDLGPPRSFPDLSIQIGYLPARQNQDPHEDYIGDRNPDLDSHSRTQSRPNQHPGQTRAHGLNEVSQVRNLNHLQTCTIGRSSDPSRTDLAAGAGRSNTQEHSRQGQCHYQTGEKVNKNGSWKRRAAREKLSRQSH
ncbi:hypothetical protein HOY80DRAFT_1005768 [Tuber brumale]|nr:hypothetical protein HOY80DRAFT_1005768 [Tuber brumale]